MEITKILLQKNSNIKKERWRYHAIKDSNSIL